MTVNEFLKKMKKEFPNMEYRATSKDGQTFKSKGWEDEIKKNNNSKRQY